MDKTLNTADTEFRSFSEIVKYSGTKLIITQKLHGTNAQILVFKNEEGILDLKVGSRTRWLFPTQDNFGFCSFVLANKQDFIEKLGEGRHFGEWVGPGINSGEGLKERILVLFDFERYTELPTRVTTVPVLFNQTTTDLSIIDSVFEGLKATGSKLVPGFMRTEGIVITLNGKRYKKVFIPEETLWTGVKKEKSSREPKITIDAAHLLQPFRLEKLLSRDEIFLKDYPKSLGIICKNYIEDLEKENQFTISDPDELKAYKKSITGQVFNFIKISVEQSLR